jgi:hypothetical protein
VSGAAAEISRLLGGLAVRVCTGAPADIAQAVQEAQHRDRISLAAGGKMTTPVDVLVPVGLDASVPVYDWVAFVRRDGRRCAETAAGEPWESIGVYLVDDTGADGNKLFDSDIALLRRGALPAADRLISLGHVAYPAGEWAVPDGGDYARIFEKIHKVTGMVAVAAFVKADERRPLGAIRALLLASRFDSDKAEAAELITVKTSDDEAIIVVIGPTR